MGFGVDLVPHRKCHALEWELRLLESFDDREGPPLLPLATPDQQTEL